MASDSHYDKTAADYAVSFIEALSHTKGTWAGKPFELIDWQEQIIRDLFGILKPDGYRQFKRYIELATLNGIVAPYTIHVGHALSIDGARLYTVKAGDSPWRIAQELLGDGRRYAEIVQMNDLKEPYTIYADQTLKIPRK